MARAFGLLALTPVVIALGLTPRADAQPPQPAQPKIKIGMLRGMFKDTPEAVVQAVALPFANLFKKQSGLDGDVKVAENYTDLADQMRNKTVDIGVFHGFEYAWVKQHPELVPLVVTVPNNPKIQAVLVVNVSSKATKPADLNGACVVVPLATKAHCYMYLDRVQESLPAGCCCQAKDGKEFTAEEALDAVANGKCQATLVDGAVLAAYQANKPGPGAELRRLSESEQLPSAVVVYRKDSISPTAISQIRNALVDANKTSQGRAFMLLWKLKGFEDVQPAYVADLDRVLKAYPPPAPPK